MIKFLQTPGKAKKIILGGLLLLICAAMVITLIPGGFLGDAFGFGESGGVLAKVGGEDISVADAQQAARQIARQQFGGRTIPPQLMPFLTQRALEGLITQKALVVEAGRMGLRVTDDELRDSLRRVFAQVLFPNGNFVGDSAYQDFVQQQFQMTVAQFEQEFKNELLINKLRDIVEGTATVSDQEVQQEYTRKNTKVKFDYAVLTYDDVMKQIQPSESELRSFFDKNKQMYAGAIPEKRRAQYVLVDPTSLKDKAQVTPDDLKRYYSQHQDQFRVPEQVNVRQILIKGTDAGARAKAQDLANKAKSGANFADLAKKNSQDSATATTGGQVGWVQRGQTMPEIDKAAFSMNKGQVSDPIQTALGFFVIQVQDKQSAHLKSIDELRAQIEPMVAQEKSARAEESIANKITTDARTAGLAAAAQKNGLNVADSGFVAPSDSLPGVGAAPEFLQALFQAREKDPATSIRTQQGFVVFQLTGIQPPAAPTFEQIKPRVEGDFKNERAGALLAQKTQQMADRAHSTHNLRAAAKEVGATVKTSEPVTIQGQVPDIGAMAGPAAVAFTMKPGDISGPIQAGRNGVVLAVLDKQEPSSADFARDKADTREEVLGQKRGMTMQIFAANLRDRMEKDGKIKINKKAVDRMLSNKGESTPSEGE